MKKIVVFALTCFLIAAFMGVAFAIKPASPRILKTPTTTTTTMRPGLAPYGGVVHLPVTMSTVEVTCTPADGTIYYINVNKISGEADVFTGYTGELSSLTFMFPIGLYAIRAQRPRSGGGISLGSDFQRITVSSGITVRVRFSEYR